MNSILSSVISADELTIVLPVRNEADHLPQLLGKLRDQVERIILVDDGSEDNSTELGRQNGVEVIRHAHRLGKTSSIRSALPSALRSEWILFMDGDGQHDPGDLRYFWKARREADAVLGVRDLKSAPMPFCRRMANRLMSWTLQRIVGGRACDTQCGYRLVRSAWLADWNPAGKEFEWETELYGRLLQTGARIKTVPIRTIYRHERSKIFWPRETWRFLKTCLNLKTGCSNRLQQEINGRVGSDAH